MSDTPKALCGGEHWPDIGVDTRAKELVREWIHNSGSAGSRELVASINTLCDTRAREARKQALERGVLAISRLLDLVAPGGDPGDVLTKGVQWELDKLRSELEKLND